MTDQMARDRVARFVRDHFDDAEIDKIDKIIRNRFGATQMDRSFGVSRGMTFDERYPDAAKIRIVEVRR